MFRYYKIPVYEYNDDMIVNNVQFIYTTTNGLLFIYNFKSKRHVVHTMGIELNIQKSLLSFTEKISYGTSTRVLKYYEDYEDYDEYFKEIEKYSIMRELIA